MDIFNLLGISKYSNSEIITPQKVADAMVNLLPDEMFTPDTTFLDPACKSGVFLTTLKSRLMNSDKMIEAFPDKKERQQHILEKQLFGIATSQTAWLMCMRTLYGYLPTTTNIVYIPNYLQRMADKTTDYKKLIQEGFKQEMTFDVIIGNPPYQENTASIYQHFIDGTIDLKAEHIVMVVKNNWLSSDTLKNTRERMIQTGIKKIINYPIVGEVFPNVGVAVNIFQIDIGHKEKTTIINVQKGKIVNKFECNLKGLPIIPINLMDYNIMHKVVKGMKECFSKEVYPAECFRVNSNMTVGRGEGKYELDTSVIKTKYYNVAVACMNGRTLDYNFINVKDVPCRLELVDTYKVICGEKLSKGENVITNINGLSNQSICNGSWGLLYANKNKIEAFGAYTYIRTRFFRYLVGIMCNGGMTGISPYRFSLVPMQDFTHSWTDEELYKKYNLTQEEIDYIESTIKPME